MLVLARAWGFNAHTCLVIGILVLDPSLEAMRWGPTNRQSMSDFIAKRKCTRLQKSTLRLIASVWESSEVLGTIQRLKFFSFLLAKFVEIARGRQEEGHGVVVLVEEEVKGTARRGCQVVSLRITTYQI